MKEKYLKPLMELKLFESEDLITNSAPDMDMGDNDFTVIIPDWDS